MPFSRSSWSGWDFGQMSPRQVFHLDKPLYKDKIVFLLSFLFGIKCVICEYMKNKRKKAYISCNALCIDYVCFVRIMYRPIVPKKCIQHICKYVWYEYLYFHALLMVWKISIFLKTNKHTYNHTCNTHFYDLSTSHPFKASPYTLIFVLLFPNSTHSYMTIFKFDNKVVRKVIVD